MAIEVGQHGSMLITGPHIETYRLLTLRYAMHLEIRTKMKASKKSDPFKIVREEFGITARSKVDVLKEFDNILRSNGMLS